MVCVVASLLILSHPLMGILLSGQAVQGEALPPLQEGDSLPITEVELKQVRPIRSQHAAPMLHACWQQGCKFKLLKAWYAVGEDIAPRLPDRE